MACSWCQTGCCCCSFTTTSIRVSSCDCTHTHTHITHTTRNSSMFAIIASDVEPKWGHNSSYSTVSLLLIMTMMNFPHYTSCIRTSLTCSLFCSTGFRDCTHTGHCIGSSITTRRTSFASRPFDCGLSKSTVNWVRFRKKSCPLFF